MRKIYTIGETVYDVIFKNDKPVDAKPGGAMLNAAISLGRLGLDINLVSDFANDHRGDIIYKFLVENNVNTSHISKYDDARSRLALAFLDNENNADYCFYKIRINGEIKIHYPKINSNDIVLFGSFYSIKKEVRENLVYFLKYAKSLGAIILYDPNFRNAHIGILDKVMPYIEENISLATIVKGSDEDFYNIFKVGIASEAYEIVKKLNCSNLVYTANKNDVELFTETYAKKYPVQRIHPLSTVGAGDTFSAGLIYGISKKNIVVNELNSISQLYWDEMIANSIEFSSQVCMSYDNYLSVDFAKTYR